MYNPYYTCTHFWMDYLWIWHVSANVKGLFDNGVLEAFIMYYDWHPNVHVVVQNIPVITLAR